MYDTIKQTKQTSEMKNELKDYFKNLNKTGKNETNTMTSANPDKLNTTNPSQTSQFSSVPNTHPSNNISLEYSSLNQGGNGSISFSTF